MERLTALKKVKSLLGPKYGYRIDKFAVSPEEREAARQELPAAQAEYKKLKEQREARRQSLLEGDAEYQRLNTECVKSVRHCEKLSGAIYRRKFTVGKSNGLFFVVKAEGDSWEEVIEKLTAKKQNA
jgi:hypothetical protein